MFEGILQPTHLILILLIALIVVGPGKLSDLGGSLGKSLREFKKAVNEDEQPVQAAQVSVPPQVKVAAEQPAAEPEANHASTVETPRS